MKGNDPSPDLPNPPPIILPYFGVVRIADRKINTRPILEDDFNPRPPNTVALHPPPPVPTMPQVQDDFQAMNMDNELLQPHFGENTPFNWDFNFAMDTNATSREMGVLPMDIEAWSSVFPLIFLVNCSIGIH